MDYLSQLNPAQREAATTTEGYIRVVAGAGSGKTKTLTARYLYLVDMLGISPANILCVTFTNKAAAEMKKRIRRQLPDRDLARITISGLLRVSSQRGLPCGGVSQNLPHHG